MVLCYMLQHPNFEQGEGFTPFDYSVVRTYDMPTYPNDTTVIQPGRITNTADNPGGHGVITGWGRTCGKSYAGSNDCITSHGSALMSQLHKRSVYRSVVWSPDSMQWTPPLRCTVRVDGIFKQIPLCCLHQKRAGETIEAP